RDRAGARGCDPQVLLHRRIRHSPAHPRDRHGDRSCHRAAASSAYRRGAQAMSETLRDVLLRDLQGLRARHREVFAGDRRQRAALLAGIILLLALAAYGFWRLDFSLNRLGSGLGQIAHMVSLMFPPSPGKHLPLYLQALTETLAIALLGTLTAAVLAFPVGFLAAKNVVPNIFAHFAVRR